MAKFNMHEILEETMKLQPDLNVKNKVKKFNADFYQYLCTPLIEACINDSIESVKVLV